MSNAFGRFYNELMLADSTAPLPANLLTLLFSERSALATSSVCFPIRCTFLKPQLDEYPQRILMLS